MAYNPETYWSRVGQEIEKRAGDNVIAGDNNPYYAYKRSKFLRRFLPPISSANTWRYERCAPTGRPAIPAQPPKENRTNKEYLLGCGERIQSCTHLHARHG